MSMEHGSTQGIRERSGIVTQALSARLQLVRSRVPVRIAEHARRLRPWPLFLPLSV